MGDPADSVEVPAWVAEIEAKALDEGHDWEAGWYREWVARLVREVRELLAIVSDLREDRGAVAKLDCDKET